MTQDRHSAQDLLLVRSSHEVAETLKRLHPETREQVHELQIEIEKVGARGGRPHLSPALRQT